MQFVEDKKMKQVRRWLLDFSKAESRLRRICKLTCRNLCLLIFVFAATACASNQGAVFHSFEFDLRKDNQDAEMLEYSYGDAKSPARAADWAVKEGKAVFFEAVTGTMRRGDSLYAKSLVSG